MTEEKPKTFEQLQQEYGQTCATLGDRMIRMDFLQQEIDTVKKKLLEINALANAVKAAPIVAPAPEAALPE